MRYIEPDSGTTYPLDQPRWCADGGGYLNLTPGAGLKRSQIKTDRYSV